METLAVPVMGQATGWECGNTFNPRWNRRVRRKKDCGHYSV
jgi:hypothetical protein